MKRFSLDEYLQLLGGMITKVINAIILLGRCTDY